jgi:endogenous inhibitor of DNA gyrase (YacG/DUF329 family)
MPAAAKQPASNAPKVRRCPICDRPASQETRPFCSSRCRDVDLNRWLSGHYVVPGSENDEEEQK